MAVTVWKNILVARGLAMCLVVLAHAIRCTASLYCSQRETLSPAESPFAFWVLIPLSSLAPICLYAFLLAAGFTFGRMYRGWPAAIRWATPVLRKYLLWAIPLFLLLALKKGEFDLLAMLTGLAEGGPMPGYWYLVLIAVLYLMAPPWVSFVQRHPRIVLFVILLIHAAACLRGYTGLPSYHPAVEGLLIKPLLFLPSFIAGLMLSSNVTAVVDFARRKYRLLVFLTFVTATLCVGESAGLAYLGNWHTRDFMSWVGAERISLTLFSIFGLLLLSTMESKKTPLSNWLSSVGVSSLGILLLMDICLKLATYLLWHAPTWVWSLPETSFSPGNVPQWLLGVSIWTLPFYLAVGLWGPLRIMSWSRHLLGNRVRVLW